MHHSPIRLSLVLAASTALFTGAAGAQTDYPPARIKIDIDRTIGEVHPHLFGNFAEHLGRMIYGGIFDEGSPLSNADGFRLDVLEAVEAGVTDYVVKPIQGYVLWKKLMTYL